MGIERREVTEKMSGSKLVAMVVLGIVIGGCTEEAGPPPEPVAAPEAARSEVDQPPPGRDPRLKRLGEEGKALAEALRNAPDRGIPLGDFGRRFDKKAWEEKQAKMLEEQRAAKRARTVESSKE